MKSQANATTELNSVPVKPVEGDLRLDEVDQGHGDLVEGDAQHVEQCDRDEGRVRVLESVQ